MPRTTRKKPKVTSDEAIVISQSHRKGEKAYTGRKQSLTTPVERRQTRSKKTPANASTAMGKGLQSIAHGMLSI